MMTSAKLIATFALAGLAAVQGQAAPLTQADFDRLDKNCADIRSNQQAAACLVAVHRAAMDSAQDTYDALAVSSRHGMLPENWVPSCLHRGTPAYTSRSEPDIYLRNARLCLTRVAHVADKENVAYDYSGVEFLLARMRRLSHLDLR